MNYANGKIYSIRSHQTEKYYIGSTCQTLTKRLSKHKANYNDWKKNGKGYITSFEILKFDDAYIELLVQHPCENKDQLRKKEGESIREHKNNCVNLVIPKRTPQEYNVDNKEQKSEYWKSYYDKNKNELLKKHKEHYNENKEQIQKYTKQYRDNHQEQIQDYMKVYRAKVTECACGITYGHAHKARHERTQTHKAYLKT